MIRFSQNKLLIVVIAVLPSAILAVCLIVYTEFYREDFLSEKSHAIAHAHAHHISSLSAVLLEQEDLQSLQYALESGLSLTGIKALRITDLQGQPLAAAGVLQQLPAAATTADHRPQQISDSGFHLFLKLPLYGLADAKGQRALLGSLQLYFDDSERLALRSSGILNIIAVVLSCCLLGLALGLAVSARQDRRTKHLDAQVTRLIAGDDQVFLDAQGEPALDQLATSINNLQRLQEKRLRTLEQDIRQSTVDLEESLETVEIQSVELDLARKEAIRASRVKSEFLANTSHEVRTPLNSIIGFSRLLVDSELNDKQRNAAEIVARSASHLLLIIDDILDFSKLEAGKLELHNGPVNIRKLISDVVELLSLEALAKSLTIKVVLDPTLPEWLQGDALRLKQVLTNLLSNAIKFSEEGQITLSVSALLVDNNQQLLAQVQDNGPGIDPMQQKNLFQAFSRLRSASGKVVQGNGLGLAICRRLVQAMGGDIDVETRPGNGARFWFSVPAPTAASPGQTSDFTIGFNGLRALVVDDNPSNVRLLQVLLEEHGAEVSCCANGPEAIALCRQRAFDVILLDYQMEILDGLDTGLRLKGLAAQKQARLIIVSAHLSAEESARISHSGIHAQLRKPVDIRQLLAVINEINDAEPALNERPDMSLDLDWELSLQRASGKADLAREMLAMLLHSLPEVLEAIASENSADAVAKLAHTLKGNCAYVGTPRLQQAVDRLHRLAMAGENRHSAETALRQAAQALWATVAKNADLGAILPTPRMPEPSHVHRSTTDESA